MNHEQAEAVTLDNSLEEGESRSLAKKRTCAKGILFSSIKTYDSRAYLHPGELSL